MVGLDVGMLEVKKHNGKGFIQPFLWERSL